MPASRLQFPQTLVTFQDAGKAALGEAHFRQLLAVICPDPLFQLAEGDLLPDFIAEPVQYPDIDAVIARIEVIETALAVVVIRTVAAGVAAAVHNFDYLVVVAAHPGLVLRHIDAEFPAPDVLSFVVADRLAKEVMPAHLDPGFVAHLFPLVELLIRLILVHG